MDLKAWQTHADSLVNVRAVLARLGQQYHCCSPEPEALFSLTFLLQEKGEILEIGTNIGTSTIALALGLKVRGTARRLHTVDMKRHPELDVNLVEAGVADRVEVVVSTSGELAKRWSAPIELLWIDGDHSHVGCLADIRAFSRHVVTGGFIGFHDFANRMGVPGAVHEAILAKPWLYRVVSDREFGSLFVVQVMGAESECPAWRDEMTPTT
jgi:predicted O-methyltransferase YrrM